MSLADRLGLGSAKRPLSPEERNYLGQLENVVSAGLRSFASVGRALGLIRDKQLYRETHDTFEAYLDDKWNISRQHATRLMEAAEIATQLQKSPTGAVPETERQVRPLASLEPDQRVAAWTEAVEASPGGKVTPAAVEAAVAKRKPKKRRAKAPKPTRIKVPGATVTVTPNKKFDGTVEQALRSALAKLEGSQVEPLRRAA